MKTAGPEEVNVHSCEVKLYYYQGLCIIMGGLGQQKRLGLACFVTANGLGYFIAIFSRGYAKR